MLNGAEFQSGPEMKMRSLITLAALAVLAACAPMSGQDEPGSGSTGTTETAPETTGSTNQTGLSMTANLRLPLPTTTTADITASDLAVRIRTLADDKFEGRAPGTEAGENAADWIAAEMDRVGLEPAGEDGTWFQTVKMIEQTVDPAKSGLTLSFGKQSRPLDVPREAVFWTKRQNETALAFDTADLVFVGYGIVAPEYGWNDYANVDAEGKTVVMLVNDPGFATNDPSLFNGESMTYYGRWTYKFEEAARRGATAAIVIHETAPASYGWDVVSNSWSGAQADLVRADGGASRTVLEGWFTRDLAEEVFAAAGLDFSAQKEAAAKRGFTAVDLGGVSASGTITQTISQATSRNVLGTVPGETRPDEYVLYTAHWDHLGKKSAEKAGEPDQDFYRDQIYNGAVDNATGVAALLDIAEAMAEQPLDRSVIFAAVTLEESGLLGSAYLAENPTVPLGQIAAGINMDGMLPQGRTRDMIVVGYGASQLEDRLAAVLQDQDRVIRPDPKPEAGYFYRSDHISFAKKGVPMLYADGGVNKRDGGVAAGKAASDAYTARRYHKPMDEYQSDWDLSGMEEDIRALYQVGLEIAQSAAWPEWYDGNEFKAIRAETAAMRQTPSEPGPAGPAGE